MEHLKPGQYLGTCRIEAFVADGGMATVYRAHQTLMDRTVAVKVLHPRLLENKTALAGFLKEGMAGARLNHPSIAQVFYTAEESGRYYIVMDFVEGQDLKTALREQGAFPVRKALEIVRQVAEVLAFTHARGILHRDIKPGNIMLSPTGNVVLTDFGIASLLAGDTAEGRQRCGTPAYMSPEQMRGEVLDERSDLYSLGATLFALLAARPPFKRSTTQPLEQQVLETPPPSLREIRQDVPRAVTSLVERLLAKRSGDRFPSARATALALDSILQDGDVGRRMPLVPRIGLPRPEDWWPVAFIGAGVAVFGVCLWCALALFESPASQPDVAVAAGAQDGQSSGETGAMAVGSGLEEFERALAGGHLDRILRLVEPASRNDPRLIRSVLSIVQASESLPSDVALSHYVASHESTEAHTRVLHGKASGGPSVTVHLTWILTPEGRWYIRPEPGTRELRFRTER